MTLLRVRPIATCRLTGGFPRIDVLNVLKRDSSSWTISPQKPHEWYSLRSGENIAEDEIAKLAALRRPPLTLGDLLKYVIWAHLCSVQFQAADT